MACGAAAGRQAKRRVLECEMLSAVLAMALPGRPESLCSGLACSGLSKAATAFSHNSACRCGLDGRKAWDEAGIMMETQALNGLLILNTLHPPILLSIYHLTELGVAVTKGEAHNDQTPDTSDRRVGVVMALTVTAALRPRRAVLLVGRVRVGPVRRAFGYIAWRPSRRRLGSRRAVAGQG